jgi:translocation and assembly module TamB
MAEEVTKRRSHKRLWIWLTLGIVLLGAGVSLVFYLRSASFEDWVRRKLIAVIEDATGGRVEMASFHWKLSQLAFEANDLTIHGLEAPGELPYVHIDHTVVRLRIISFLQRQFSLQQLELQHPVIHIIVYPNGSTNAPEPKVKQVSNKTPVQELFDLAIARTDLHDGVLLLNERKVPLDFSVNDLVAAMSYDARAQRFDGSVQVGKMDIQYQDYRDIPAQADLQFSLWHSEAAIKSLKLTSQSSSVLISGKLTNFDNPQTHLTYSSTINAGQLGAIMRVNQLRAGTVLLDGSGTYSSVGGYASTGRIAVRDLDYVDAGLSLRKAGLNSNFSVDNDHLVLSRIAARLLGGQINGDADIKNLMATTPPNPPAPTKPAASTKRTAGTRQAEKKVAAVPAGPQQEGTGHFRASGISLNEVARLISSRAFPVDKLNAAGTVSGTINLSWKQSLENTLADLTLDIASPSAPAANQLPVNGNLRGRYGLRSGRMEVTSANLNTPRSHVDGSGSLSDTSAALKLNANTISLAEFDPMLKAMGSTPLPIELNGAANFNGTLSGRWRAPQVAGHLQATNFTYIYTPATAAPAQQTPAAPPKHRSWFHMTSTPEPPPTPVPVPQPRRIHIDEFSGDVQYSQSGVGLHHAAIKEGSAQLTVDGSSTLDRGNFTPSSQFQVQAAIHDADIAELQRAVGTDYPVSGKLNLSVQAAGTQLDPHGHGQLSLTDGQAHGRPIISLTSKILFANHAAELDNIRLQAEHGTVVGSAGYNFQSREVKLDLTGKSIDLADIPEVQRPRLKTAGVADFTVKGSGTLDQPIINAHLRVDNLVLNEDVLGALQADAVTHGRQLTLTARSTFPKATFALDGKVDLEGNMPANATLQFANLDVNPFLPEEMRKQVTRPASLDGQAQLSGPLKEPRQLRAHLAVQQFSVEVQHILIKSDGPVEVSLANEIATVQRCTIVSQDTHFTVAGTASLAGDRALNLSADGSLNLKLLETLNHDVTSYGVSNINVKIRGTASDPRMSGQLVVVHAGLSMIDLPAGLGDVNGTLVFNQDRLEVENLSGRMGGGHMKFGGSVSFGRTIGFDLTADGSDIRFRYSGISVTSDQSLHLTGTLQNASVTGNITVTRFAQIPTADLQFFLAEATAPPSIPNPTSPLNNLHLEIRVLSSPELTVQTSLAKLSGDIDLRLRGTAARPILLGRVSIAEGDIKLGGTKYHLERGDIAFLNPIRIDPVLDVEATTRVRDYDITIGLHGTMERLNTTYRSDPPLSSDDIISLLAFGRTQSESAYGAGPSPGLSQGASSALLSAALNQAVTNRVSKLFGGSTIRINPAFGGPENDPNARLTIEQQVTSNVTFTIVTDLARSAQEIIQFEYNITNEYTLQGLRDENGVVSFDLLIRKRKP